MAYQFIQDVKQSVADGIPSSSFIVGEIIKAIYDEKSDAGDIAEIIERDPPLTAKILKTANSAYYGASKRITSLQRAVIVLGFDTIKELVTTITMVHTFFRPDAPHSVDRAGLWLHSVGVAKATQLLSRTLGLDRPDVAYTIGLLHDIGKIVIAMSFPESFARVIQYVKQKKCAIIDAERILLNVDHCMLGKILCDMWDLPEELSTAILYHHNPFDIPEAEARLARLVYHGDQMCRKAGLGSPGDELTPSPDTRTLEVFGKSVSEVNKNYNTIYLEFLQEKEEIESFFAGLK